MMTKQPGESHEVGPFKAWLPKASPLFTWDWPHLLYIQKHLGAVTRGEIDRLMIFMPPRHGKSELTTIRYPAWRLERNPRMHVIIGAYNQTLASKFSRGARRIVRKRIGLSDEKSAAKDWETSAGGGVRAVGVGGGITGHGGHLIIIDDPVKSREEANSEAYRERVWNWYKDDLYTRLEPGGAIILIMTRWHEDDLAGRILASDQAADWKVLSLPAIAEEPEEGKPGDPLGREPGEALCPDRFDLKALRDIKRTLGNSFFALYQQSPQPPSGNFFKRAWFQIVGAAPARGQAYFVRYWDKAATADDGDYTAGVLMALTKDGRYFVVDVQRGQWASEERDAIIKQTAALDRQKYGHVEIWVEREGGSSGKDAARAFVKMMRGYPAYAERITGKGNKEVRAEPLQAQAMIRNVRLVEGDWNSAYIEELVNFPTGSNDDQVDASTGAFRRVNVIAARHEESEDEGEAPAADGHQYVGAGSMRGML